MKKIINIILMLIIIIILTFFNIKKIEDSHIKNKSVKASLVIKEDIKVEKRPDIFIENIQDMYSGYKVSSKLTIPKINLETLILEDYSEAALRVSVTKFWGVNANEIGNFCIAGHNFKRKNMFHDLKKLEINDVFYIDDNKFGRHKYQIYDLYKVYPEDTSCLEQNTDGKREVTLITCTNDSKQRIIVKAKEVYNL